jgi:hypothetical protein
MLRLVKLLPSYWLVHAGRAATLGDGGWPAEGWIVVAAWALAMIALVGPVYRRDTGRS